MARFPGTSTLRGQCIRPSGGGMHAFSFVRISVVSCLLFAIWRIVRHGPPPTTKFRERYENSGGAHDCCRDQNVSNCCVAHQRAALLIIVS